jgi:hypothetical protein
MSKKILISFADKKFRSGQKLLSLSGRFIAKFDKIYEYNESDIDSDFYNKNIKILSKKKGFGYWLWKPYIINKTLVGMEEGDYLFYSDSGAFFINKIDHLYKMLEVSKKSIMVFELPLIEKQWTKKELFYELNLERLKDSNQIMASFILIKKCSESATLISTFLEHCKNKLYISDVVNNESQDKLFIEHRHDQSIFSLISKKNNLTIAKDPSQFGIFPNLYFESNVLLNKDINYFDGSAHMIGRRKFRLSNALDVGFILYHHRRRDPIIALISYLIFTLRRTINEYIKKK